MPTNTFATPAANTPGDRRHWGQLYGAAKALAIISAANQFDGLTLVLTESAKSAAALERELRFFSLDDAQFPILHFPDWETLPYDLFSPHQDIISERLQTLHQLPSVKRGVLVVPASTAMHRLPPASFITDNSFVYKVGEKLDIDRLRQQFQQSGYHCVETVYEHGEYAVRGALIDVFPMGSTEPFRIDLFDDEIETLRSFDPETQRTLEKTSRIALLPAKEFPQTERDIKRFLDNWNQQFEADPRQSTIYQDIRNGNTPSGIEYYLPLFFEKTATLFQHLPANTLLFTDSEINTAVSNFWHESIDRYESYGVDNTRPLLRPHKLFLPTAEFFSALGQLPRTDIQYQALEPAQQNHNFASHVLPDISIDSKANEPFDKLETFLIETEARTLFCAESPGRREVLIELLTQIGVTPEPVTSWQDFHDSKAALCICVYPLERGLQLDNPAVNLISESELFGQQIMQRRRRSRQKGSAEQIVKNLTELQLGAPVVHIDHGVGRYCGLTTMDMGGEPLEFLELLYADDAKLFVPVANLHLISRYSGGDADSAPLYRLGSERWQKAKDKAARQIRDTAAELLNIYARREAREGYTYKVSTDDYKAFSAEFPFEETPDQIDAIEAVCSDMAGTQPMDRLICGDVGFGKTEVAMRAAFLAATNGKQIVILVPTTLLAQQHHDTFNDRFANWPINIAVISRFKTGKEQTAIFQKVAEGNIDILIGTHKLLSSKIEYHNLGLLVIDEEHRFGVNQKEKLKALRSEVDILTLTATPIPRTLNMAMGGIRDLSIIATPPARRLSVKTFVHQNEPRIIREAILREILRGGQVYYLHNEVKTIEKTASELQALLPEARIDIAHGQMRERELEKVMSDFYHQRNNILVCTTIIETGIDVPTANTIIMDRADKLGLAQLHQLRGRVGRSHHQAYAYLLTPDSKLMSDDAHKRLEAITAADQLGSGFTLATHDLEIRGAGELLGDGQSGHIHTIGFSLYMDLLERAVEAIREGKTPDIDKALNPVVEVNLNIPALIPDDYLPDIHTRLILYKRIGNTKNSLELRELQVEMIDRFGLLPDYVKNLFRVTTLRQRAEQLGIIKLQAGAANGTIEFGAETTVEPLTIVQLVQQQPDLYQLQGATHLRYTLDMHDAEERLQICEELLDLLSPPQGQTA